MGHINNTVVLLFGYFQYLHLMYSELVWVIVSLGTQFQSQIILEPDYLPDYLPFLMIMIAHILESSNNFDRSKISYYVRNNFFVEKNELTLIKGFIELVFVIETFFIFSEP